jgi:hypothetical protein
MYKSTCHFRCCFVQILLAVVRCPPLFEILGAHVIAGYSYLNSLWKEFGKDFKQHLAFLCYSIIAFLIMSRPQMETRNSRLQYFVFGFVLMLAMGCVSSPYFALPSVAAEGAYPAPAQNVCHTHDLPNPIASLYPNNATGTLNGTVSLLPISLELARSIIPPQYRILEHAYRALLPSFPEGMYPAVLQAVHDHDVQAMGFKIPDFSVSIFPTKKSEKLG